MMKTEPVNYENRTRFLPFYDIVSNGFLTTATNIVVLGGAIAVLSPDRANEAVMLAGLVHTGVQFVFGSLAKGNTNRDLYFKYPDVTIGVLTSICFLNVFFIHEPLLLPVKFVALTTSQLFFRNFILDWARYRVYFSSSSVVKASQNRGEQSTQSDDIVPKKKRWADSRKKDFNRAPEVNPENYMAYMLEEENDAKSSKRNFFGFTRKNEVHQIQVEKSGDVTRRRETYGDLKSFNPKQQSMIASFLFPNVAKLLTGPQEGNQTPKIKNTTEK